MGLSMTWSVFARFINVNKAIIAGGMGRYLVHTAGVASYLSRLPMASSVHLILHTSRRKSERDYSLVPMPIIVHDGRID